MLFFLTFLTTVFFCFCFCFFTSFFFLSALKFDTASTSSSWCIAKYTCSITYMWSKMASMRRSGIQYRKRKKTHLGRFPLSLALDKARVASGDSEPKHRIKHQIILSCLRRTIIAKIILIYNYIRTLNRNFAYFKSKFFAFLLSMLLLLMLATMYCVYL